MGKNVNTYEKRRREFEKKRKADEKRAKRRNRKDGVDDRESTRDSSGPSDASAADQTTGPSE